MIVVDSSVWIANLRGQDNAATRTLHALAANDDDQLMLGDLILLEVLQGARDEAHAIRIERDLMRFPIVAMLNEKRAVQAARNYRRLRDRGITVRKTIDMIIGTYCLDENHQLLHNDRDFDAMVRHLGLRVIQIATD